jgi:hypothetical protein
VHSQQWSASSTQSSMPSNLVSQKKGPSWCPNCTLTPMSPCSVRKERNRAEAAESGKWKPQESLRPILFPSAYDISDTSIVQDAGELIDCERTHIEQYIREMVLKMNAGIIHAAGTPSWTNARNSAVQHLYPLPVSATVASPPDNLQVMQYYKVRDPMMHLINKCLPHLLPHLPPRLVPQIPAVKYLYEMNMRHTGIGYLPPFHAEVERLSMSTCGSRTQQEAAAPYCPEAPLRAYHVNCPAPLVPYCGKHRHDTLPVVQERRSSRTARWGLS